MDLKESLEPGHGTSPLRHWYYATKYLYVREFVQRNCAIGHAVTIADFGCGSGVFLEALAREFQDPQWRFHGVDVNFLSPPQSTDARITYHKRLPENVIVDLFLFMDVIEHVPEDTSFLGKIFLTHGSSVSRAFITVPAFEILWSSHDVYLGHYRRYNIRSLTAAIPPGVRISRPYFLYATLFPIVALLRVARRWRSSKPKSDLTKAPPLVNHALTLLFRLEKLFLRRSNHSFGLTLAVEARLDRTR